MAVTCQVSKTFPSSPSCVLVLRFSVFDHRSFRRHDVLATVDAADIRGLGTARLLCVAELTHSRHGPCRRNDRRSNTSCPCAESQRGAGDTSCAIAQTNPESSRAIAVATFGFAFPRATSRLKRAVRRSWAFQAMAHTTFDKAS